VAKTGDILGNTWKLGDELGSGAMATVYRGAHRNGATAAIKVLHRTFSGEVDLCERFLSEGYLTNKVQHPGIVRVFDDGMTEDGCPFLARDLLEGMTLEGKRQQAGGRLSLEETLKLCDGIMDVLDTVHAAGIVHRDVKTTNVFLTNDGKLKVLDFGMARSLMSRGAAKGSLLNPVVGTPSFMAPEQALGQRDLVDGQSDQWGVAAIAFLLLCGEPVHVAGSTEARLFAAASNPARSILAPLPMLDKNVAAVIDRALSYRKADRWPTMRAMRKALAQAAGAVEPEEAAPISAWQRLPRKAPRSTEVPPAPPPVAAAAPAKPAPTVAAVATKAAAPIPIAHAVEGTLPLVNRPVAPQARPAASARGPVAKNKVEGTLPLVATGGSGSAAWRCRRNQRTLGRAGHRHRGASAVATASRSRGGALGLPLGRGAGVHCPQDQQR
jgi:serine/threonine-protein kinase